MGRFEGRVEGMEKLPHVDRPQSGRKDRRETTSFALAIARSHRNPANA